MSPARLWYLRRAVPWVAVISCLALAALLSAATHRWPTSAVVLLPFAVASGAAAAGFLLDDAGSALTGSTPRGGRWAEGSRLATLPVIGVLVLALVGPAAGAAGLSALAWSGVSLVSVALGLAVARALRVRVPAPGTHVAVVLVLATALPFTVGALLGWVPPWPEDELSGWVAAFWASLAGVSALVLVSGLLRGDPGGRGRSASMAP